MSINTKNYQRRFSIDKQGHSRGQQQHITTFMQAVNTYFNKDISQNLEINGKLQSLSFIQPGSLLYLENDYKDFSQNFTIKDIVPSGEYSNFNKQMLSGMEVKGCSIESIDNSILLFGSMQLSKILGINLVSVVTPIILFVSKVEVCTDKETRKLTLTLCDQKRNQTGVASITYSKNN